MDKPIYSMDLCLKKLSNTRDSIRLPGVFITGSQLRIQITPRIFEIIQNRFWTCLLDQGSCLMKKAGEEKSRGTVPLSVGTPRKKLPAFLHRRYSSSFYKTGTREEQQFKEKK